MVKILWGERQPYRLLSSTEEDKAFYTIRASQNICLWGTRAQSSGCNKPEALELKVGYDLSWTCFTSIWFNKNRFNLKFDLSLTQTFF